MNQITFQKDKVGIGKRKQAVARVFLTSGEGISTPELYPA